jgi:FkbM family methyltransferase
MSVLFFKALYPEAEVVAIEPHPAAFSLLSRNVERNQLRGVRLINAGVAEADGELTLHFESGDAGSLTASIDPAWGGRWSQTVPAMRVSPLARETVDFLKLDVEGAEYGVVRDLAATGALANVRETVIEYHEIGSEPGQTRQLPKMLEAAGFQIDSHSFDAAAGHGLLRARRRAR